MNITPTQLQQSHELFQKGLLDQAKTLLEKLVSEDITSAEAFANLGYINYLQSNISEAIKNCQQSIKLDPELIAGYINLSLALIANYQIDQAETILQSAIKSTANSSVKRGELFTNLAICYQKKYQFSKAIEQLQQAILLDPQAAENYCNLALCFQETGKIDQALIHYEQALGLNPEHQISISNYLLCLQYYSGANSQLLRQTAVSRLQPLNARYLSDTPEKIPEHKLLKNEHRFNIGFVSADFREHPVGWFFVDVLNSLIKHQCQCYCYSNSRIQDSVTEEIKTTASKFLVIAGKSDAEVIQLINQDHIDVLVDLSGHTADNRLSLFAQGAAAVQVAWLGYLATTAIDKMDAVILSQDLICASTQHFFNERVQSLDASQFIYSPPKYLPDLPEICPQQKNGIITFGCFNNIAKLNDEVLVTWTKILHQIPDSQLLLKWKSFQDQDICDFFYRRFHNMGIRRNRLILRGASHHKQMLQEYNQIDIALDPFPFSGALTSIEALWMGVPIVTLYMDRPLSRQTYCINKSLGLGKFSCTTPAQYIKTAVDLARDKLWLSDFRKNCRLQIQQSALSNADQTAVALKNALIESIQKKGQT
jgi:protein O-GlcNAc transferase